MARRARAEVEADRAEADKLAEAQAQPTCAAPGCGRPAHLPCHACGASLCADHGLTRLLVAHCAACAASEVDVNVTFSSLHTSSHASVATSMAGSTVPARPAEEDDMATKAKATKAKSAGTTKWGRIGTASEMYKRLIMDQKLGNAACYEHVKKELGPKKAGKPTYAGWYRAKLKADGVKNVPASK